MRRTNFEGPAMGGAVGGSGMPGGFGGSFMMQS
jgi:hypothetical protein